MRLGITTAETGGMKEAITCPRPSNERPPKNITSISIVNGVDVAWRSSVREASDPATVHRQARATKPARKKPMNQAVGPVSAGT